MKGIFLGWKFPIECGYSVIESVATNLFLNKFKVFSAFYKTIILKEMQGRYVIFKFQFKYKIQYWFYVLFHVDSAGTTIQFNLRQFYFYGVGTVYGSAVSCRNVTHGLDVVITYTSIYKPRPVVSVI